MPQKTYITLIRHTEYNPACMDLTERGFDVVGLIAQHVDTITHKSPIAKILIKDSTVSVQAHEPLPPIDAVVSSTLARAITTKITFVQSLAAARESRRRLMDLGQHDFLNEGFYPNAYDRFTAYDFLNPIDYNHFTGLQAFLAGLPRNYRHIAFFAHAPSIRAISLAIIGKRRGAEGNFASDQMATIAEHELRPSKSEFGMTVTFSGQNWDTILGYGAMVGRPFLPSRDVEPVHELPPLLRSAILGEARKQRTQ